jgi:hypothetical protein
MHSRNFDWIAFHISNDGRKLKTYYILLLTAWKIHITMSI